MSMQQKSLGIVLKTFPSWSVCSTGDTETRLWANGWYKRNFPNRGCLMTVADTSNAACLELEFRWAIKLLWHKTSHFS